MRKLLVITLSVALVAVAMFRAFSVERDKAPGKGDAFIDFRLKGLDGKTYDTEKLRADKYAVVKLGQTTCPACRRQDIILKSLHDEWKRYPLEVLDIYIAEPVERIKDYLRENETPYTVLTDEDAGMARRYQVRFIPAVYIVDPDGKIIYKGNLTGGDEFERILTPLLQKELEKKEREG
jgi:peroxiredoxin